MQVNVLTMTKGAKGKKAFVFRSFWVVKMPPSSLSVQVALISGQILLLPDSGESLWS